MEVTRVSVARLDLALCKTAGFKLIAVAVGVGNEFFARFGCQRWTVS